MTITYTEYEAEYGSTAGEVANPACGQLNRENKYFLVCPRSRLRVCLTRRVRPSDPASACSFSTLRLNMVLTHGIPPGLRGGVLCAATGVFLR